MKKRTISTIGMMAAILMTVSGAELAFARGGGGKGGGSCNGTNYGKVMSPAGETNQHKYKQQNQYQYNQDNGAFDAQSGKG